MTSYVSKNTVGVLALAAVAVMAFCWFLAAVCDPGWQIGEDPLSKLGTSKVEAAANIFNYGFCLIGGAMIAIVGALYLLTLKTKKVHIIMALLVIITGIAVACLGICPYGEEGTVDRDVYTGLLHTVVAAGSILFVLAVFDAWFSKKYFDGIILTAGLFITVTLIIVGLEVAEISMTVSFLMLATLYGANWLGQKAEKDAGLYETRLNA